MLVQSPKAAISIAEELLSFAHQIVVTFGRMAQATQNHAIHFALRTCIRQFETPSNLEATTLIRQRNYSESNPISQSNSPELDFECTRRSKGWLPIRLLSFQTLSHFNFIHVRFFSTQNAKNATAMVILRSVHVSMLVFGEFVPH